MVKKIALKFGHSTGHCALYISVRQQIYVIAGDEQQNCEYYDINTDSCTEIAPVNDKGKYNASACLFNDKFIYLIGGRNQNNFLEKLGIDGNNEWIVVDIKN